MGEEEEEEDGDSEGREADYSNMLAVDITEQVQLPEGQNNSLSSGATSSLQLFFSLKTVNAEDKKKSYKSPQFTCNHPMMHWIQLI